VRPAIQLVVKVFDPWPEWNDRQPPGRTPPDAQAESGRGLALVAALSAEWGRHRSLARLTPRPIRGKAVYFAVPLSHTVVQPARPYIPV
jgi:hypothetical protein